MARPLWNGAISFGLLHIPVQLMPGERRTDLRFHLVDARDKARVRYERVNEDTGEEVPWKDIAKAFEYEKGNYVVLEDEDFKNAAPDSSESVDIESFIGPDEIGPEYFERPYFLVPPSGKKQQNAAKGYVLLRETLKKLDRVALARVVIRSREHLALLRPLGTALQLIVLRYPQELVPLDDYAFPAAGARTLRVSDKEMAMARQLVESMSEPFKPDGYRDEFREKLGRAIRERMRRKGAKVSRKAGLDAGTERSDKVVDFMALLQQSIASNKRSPARRANTSRTVSKQRAAGGKRKRS